MSGKRIEELLNYFSVEYSSIEVCDDGTIWKISPGYKLLVGNFQKAVYPDTSLSLNQSLLLRHGILDLSQCIKKKSKKKYYGIKFFDFYAPSDHVLNIDTYKRKHYSISTISSKTPKIHSLVLMRMSL